MACIGKVCLHYHAKGMLLKITRPLFSGKSTAFKAKTGLFFIEIIAFLSEMGQKMLHILPDFTVTHCNTPDYTCTRKLPEFSSNRF